VGKLILATTSIVVVSICCDLLYGSLPTVIIIFMEVIGGIELLITPLRCPKNGPANYNG
jgi:hypothetical protein